MLTATVRFPKSGRLAALLLALALPPALGGCASAVVGAGAAVGVAAYEERTIGTVADDTKMSAQIRFALLETGEQYVTKIGVEVFEGRVLLTGAVSSEKMRADAVGVAWKIAGVKDVLNEIQISESGFLNTARDAWITTQLKAKITFDEKVHAINYAIETVNGVVYLIGIAQDQVELDRVVAYARDLNYVQKVISHVRLKQARS